MSTATTGLFMANWRIGKTEPGATILMLSVSVGPGGLFANTIDGEGNITQAVNPPLSVQTFVTGGYEDQGASRVVQLVGNPIPPPPPHSPRIGPVAEPNFHLKMTLDHDWREGYAEYTFSDPNTNQTVSIGPVPVALDPIVGE